MVIGLAVTMAAQLPLVVLGLVIFAGGFFGAHTVASGWTPVLATEGRGQAAGLYNFAYYAGSSAMGWAGGIFFGRFGWTGVVAFTAALAVIAAFIAWLALRGLDGTSPQRDLR